MSAIQTEVKFEAAHRQFNDPSKCGYLHGHNWKAIVLVHGKPNEIGYVVDFKDIKEAIVGKYDHKTILYEDDPLCDILEQAGQKVARVSLNPTCECMADILVQDLSERFSNLEYIQVSLYENDVSFASDFVML